MCKKQGNRKDYEHTHTHSEAIEIGYVVQQLPTSVRLSLDVRCFTIYQLGYTFDLSETRLPFSYSCLLLTIS